MPAGPVLATAPDIGQHVDTALFQPGLAQRAAVIGNLGNLETAIAAQQGGMGAIQLQALGGHLEVGHPRAVLGSHEVLADLAAGSIEEGWRALQGFRLSTHATHAQRRGRQEIRDVHEVVVRCIRIHAGDAHGAHVRRAQEGLALPVARLHGRQHGEAVLHIVQHIEDQVMARPAEALQRRGGGGFEQHHQLPLARHVVVEARGYQ